MSKRDNKLLLLDILEAAKKIKKYTAGFDRSTFDSDDKTVDAVIRNFEIIGEAANRVENAFKVTHSQIEWERLCGFRNRLIHEYFGVDHDIVWDIISNYLDGLIRDVEAILN